MLEHLILWVGQFSMRWNMCFDLTNSHLLETCISLYIATFPCAGKLPTVCPSSFHQFKNLLWLNDFIFAGKLYRIRNQIVHMLENCLLWVCRFSTRWKIWLEFLNSHLLENRISLYKANLIWSLLGISILSGSNRKHFIIKISYSCVLNLRPLKAALIDIGLICSFISII